MPPRAAVLAVISGGASLLCVRMSGQEEANVWSKFTQNILDTGKNISKNKFKHHLLKTCTKAKTWSILINGQVLINDLFLKPNTIKLVNHF